MTVSLCVVAYNEESFLHNLLSDISNQTYEHSKIEVVLVNSASTDNTRKIMEDFASSDHDFRSVLVVDNKRRKQASGWNIAISASSGDAIIRIDAHSHIPPTFTELNVKNLESGEYVSGGVRPCIIENDSDWGKTLLRVENSLFGSSFNKCRRSVGKTYVKTMFHAAYRREVFAKAGGFNENLLRTEDNEMHYRIRSVGYKLSFDSSIVSYQYARSTFKRMVKQKYGNGKWIGLTLGVAPGCISPFHLVPFCFILAILGTTAFSALGFWQLSALMWGMYSAFALVNTVLSIIKDGFLLQSLLMPFLFLILHLAYGIGTFVGVCQMPFKRNTLKYCEDIDIVRNAVLKSLENKQ